MAYTTINKSTDHFDTLLYTGDGSATQSISGLSFSPGWIWIKDRDDTHDHYSFDAVRTNKKGLEPSDTSAERTPTLGSIDNDGFTFASSDGFYNANGDNYVSWNWKANGAGSSNTDGSITATVSANTTAGFSIIRFTGTGSVGTIGHGLGAKPNVIFQKRLDTATAWTAYHDKFDANPSHKYLYLDKNDALADYNLHWNDTEPTASLITLGSDSSVNPNGYPSIIYAFTEKTGFSKFGSYTGNNGKNFIYTGFKPKWFMFKRYDSADNWKILDVKRSTYNIMNKTINADLGNAEGTEADVYVDFLSNGIRLDGSNGALNANGANYVFMAFGQSIVGTNDVPVTAR